MNIDRRKLTKIVAEAMTNLNNGYTEEVEPWNEVDGIESVQDEYNDNPLDSPSNNMYENSYRKNRLTERELRIAIKESVNRCLKKFLNENL